MNLTLISQEEKRKMHLPVLEQVIINNYQNMINIMLYVAGNRIATLLMYVSDVEQGGATVFPHLGISLWPRQGSAVFWFNLHQNGEGDDMTRHAACPVLAGTKWVSNFWIHERGQEFARPCSIDPFV